MPVLAVVQLAMDEHVVEDADLEQALEARQRRKDSLGAVRAAYKEADELARGSIAKQELPEGTVLRCGRFRVERRTVPGRSVSFETEGKSRVSISLVEG